MGVNAIACAPVRAPAPERELRAWTTYLGGPDRAPSAHALPPADPTLAWSFDIGKSAAGAIALGDSVLAVLGSDMRLALLDRATGHLVWQSRIDRAGATGPLFDGQFVYAGSEGDDGRVYAYGFADGRRAWRTDVGPVSGPLLATGGRIIAATRRGTVVALSASSGRVAWRGRLPGPVRSGVAAAGALVLVATDDSLYVLDTSGSVIAAQTLPGAALAPPTMHGDLAIVTSPDGFVVAYDAPSLTEQWRVATGDPVFGSAAVARDTAYAVTSAGTLWAVPLRDPSTPHRIETGAAVRAGPAPVARGVLISTVPGDVLWVDDGRARPAWRIQVRGPLEHPPLVDRGELFVMDGFGRLHVFR